MKYTKFLINGKHLNLDTLDTSNSYLKQFYTLIMIIVVFIGIIAVIITLPMAIIADGYRSIKYQAIILNKNHLHLKYTEPHFLSKKIPDIMMKINK